jgi:transposase
MKTNTPPHSQTQDRIQQLKLGVDWHADQFRVVRMCDGQSPQPAQRFTPASFLLFVQKQLTQADQVFVVYEAGPGGFHLHRQLTALGVTAFVVHPVKLDPQHKGVVTDKTDARELALKLDRYLGGNTKAMSLVRVPTEAEEPRRSLSRQREQLRRERQRLAAQGRSLCLTQGIRLGGTVLDGIEQRRIHAGEAGEHLGVAPVTFAFVAGDSVKLARVGDEHGGPEVGEITADPRTVRAGFQRDRSVRIICEQSGQGRTGVG